MITEIDRRDSTSLYLLKTVKLTKKGFNELYSKITKLQKQPFAKIYVFVLPMILPDLLKEIKNKDLRIKNMVSDNKLFRLEF